MTDPSLHPNLPVATPAQPQIGPFYSPTRSHQSPYEALNANIDEDDSTIKCICRFKHDDGSSVFCESCKTWQHVECYYWIAELGRPKSKDELEKITHFCMDCHKRSLDIQGAIDRQKTRLDGLDQDEKKAKKPPPKSHKKKTKPTDTNGIVTNGWSPDLDGVNDRSIRSPRDHALGAKKPKSSHKSSHSVGLSALSQNTTSNSHKRSVSAVQSPVKTTHRPVPNQSYKEHFSDTFMHLYDDDRGDQNPNANLLSNISITDDLANWAKDIEALREATRMFSHQEVFHKLEWPLEKVLGTPPRKESREDPRVCINGRHPRWIYLTSDGFAKKDTIVGELKGAIGHMRDYIQDPDNRWDELRHPVPFVFFHPKLPIYIDTRDLGTLCRYLRRSCRPNLHMTTFLENGSDYRFCFTAKEDIDPGAELTIGWTLDEHMRKFVSNKSDMTQDLSPGGEEYVAGWVSKVSAEFGGCACNSPETCWVVRYDSEYKLPSNRKMPQARRKTQPDPHDSSDADDTRSSSRSNSGSRGITPIGPYGISTAQGLDISERDKRKIAALEKSWETDKHQPAPKRKKRNSGSSAHPSVSAPTVSLPPHGKDDTTNVGHQQKPLASNSSSVSLPNTPGLPSRPQYVDVGTSGRKSGSPTAKGPNGFGRPKGPNSVPPKSSWSHPNTPTIPSPLRSTYVSTAVQTDPDVEGDWLQAAQPSSAVRKPYLSMTKRLLLQSQKDRQQLVERRKSSESATKQASPAPQNIPNASEARTDSELPDVSMPDATHHAEYKSISSAQENTPRVPAILEEPRPPPSPLKDQDLLVNGTRDLSRPPQSPTVSPPTSTISPQFPPASTLPASHTTLPTPLQPPPITSTTHPSPIKKTINLQEYMKRKASSSTESRTTPGTVISSPETAHRTLKPPIGIAHTQTEPIQEHNSAIVDTPKKEDDDPMEMTASDVVEEPEAVARGAGEMA